jgi:hypothetical protein
VTDGLAGLSGEQVNRLVLFRELEQLLDGSFTGEIVLNCHQGEVVSYKVNELRKPGEERRSLERRC